MTGALGLLVLIAAAGFAGCGGGSVPSNEELAAWAGEYCDIHQELAASLAAADEGEEDPAAMVASERLARAERVGAASIEAYSAAAADLRALGGPGPLDEAADSRAASFDARASAWTLALALFEEDADDPDFDAGNDILVETGDRADAEWRGALDGLDPYVRYAALAGAECE